MDNPITPAFNGTFIAIAEKAEHHLAGLEAIGRQLEGTEFWRTLRKRWIPAGAVTATVLTGVAISTLREAPQYQSETLILVDSKSSVSAIVGSGSAPAPIADPEADLSTEIQILRSRSLIAKALKTFDKTKFPVSVEEVAANLTIRQMGKAKVLAVSYVGGSPATVKAVLDALGTAYVDYSLESRRSRATNAIQFIKDQLPKARETLGQSALELRQFRKRHGIVDPDSYAASVVQTKQSLEQQGYQAAITLSQTNRQYQELVRQMASVGLNPQTALASSMLGQDQGYQELAKKLQQIDLTYTQESLRFQDNHPIIQNLKIQKAEVLQLLQQRTNLVLRGTGLQVDPLSVSASDASITQTLANQLLQVQTSLAVQTAQLYSIRKTQNEVADRFQQVPQLQQEYAELQRQYNLNSQAVNRFLERLQELGINEAQEISPWQVLEPAYLPAAPISPNLKRSLLMGLILSCALGMLAAMMLERLDEKVKDLDEVKTLTGIPLLGTIPKIDLKVVTSASEGQAARHYAYSPFTEAMRSLALNLHYLSPSRGARTLALTSAIPKEGKSTTTYNLGLVLAELGQRVLIVDADMHRPTIHRFLQEKNPLGLSLVANTMGLSTAIATDRPWQELVHTGDSEYLHVMTAGPMPPNPMALLNSQKMTDLLQEWRDAYDYVLIDTPPIVGITDAQSIATRVDGMILVVAVDVPPRSAITRAVEILQATQCNLAGLVVNMIEQDARGSYYQYYSSYYKDVMAGINANDQNSNGHNGHNGNGYHPEQSQVRQR